MNIKLDHINLTVADLSDSIAWYKNIFGFKLVESGLTPQGARWGIVAFNDSMICMSEYSGLLSADSPKSSSSHQIYHFGIRVSDAEEWQQIVLDNNLKLYYGGKVDYLNSTSWYIHDPSGHEIEVSYTSKERLYFPGESPP